MPAPTGRFEVEGLFLGGSLLAAFAAGTVALFAPCCIVVMFPAFLAASVRNHRWRLVPLTFVFAAGVATVLVPVTLGLGLLTESLLRYHTAVYGLGALLLLALAVVSLSGGTWSLPFLRGSPDISRTDSAGVYALGVFSGAASACCAPVLAGVLTLSAVSPGIAAGVGIGMAYVFGMVFPLVILTLLWDRLRPDRVQLGSRQVSFRIGPVRVATTTAGLAAAAMFLVMAVVLAVVAVTGSSLAPNFTASLGTGIEGVLTPLLDSLAWIPDPVIGVLLIAVAVAAIAWSTRRRRGLLENEEQDERSCHDQDQPAATRE
ncbi:MAG TPA: cytochrome c biogenesis protein CcdA [Acidimicrobiia bacterium]|nr:cytochrome c biogenesis protein CcdA [Acidimicrobiia bacterium]